MKKLFLLLALASIGHANVADSTPVQELDAGIRSPSLVPQGTPVYTLNNALTGTAGSAIDLSGTSGLWVTVTGTSQVRVSVYFANTNISATTGAFSMYQINAPGSYSIEPKGRYVSFANSGSLAAAKVSVTYVPVVASAGSVSVSGVIPVNISYTVKVDAQGSSIVAYVPTGQGLSVTAAPVQNSLSGTTYVWQTYTAAVHNLTSVAGANVRCMICFAPSTGGAGIRMAWGTSATAPSDLYSVGAPIATSANAQCFGPYAPGTIVYSQGSGSSAVTGRIQVDGVY